MTTSRRHFLLSSAALGAGLALSHRAFARADAPAPSPASKSLKILILGGTGFLGPACVESALARGHTLTLFNRGRTEGRRERAGRPSAVPDGVEVLYGNRDPNKTADADNDPDRGEPKDPDSPKGLSALEGRSWDAVIDTSGHWPRIVGASASLLAPNVKQYVHISSISVYTKNDTPDMDETAPVHTLSDPTIEDFGPQFENYGGGKAMAEAAAEIAMPGRATILRPGYIVGPRDTSRRWSYWPVRASRGDVMLVPGTPADPIQIIDVRDCADFILHCIERRTFGVFNVTGPAAPLTMREMVDACIRASGSDAKPAWVSTGFLKEHGVEANFPIWIAPEGETAGFHRVSIAKALQAGLTSRPVEETAKATLAWIATLPPDLQKNLIPEVVTPDQERQIAEAWRNANP